jgi:hypothetical protein
LGRRPEKAGPTFALCFWVIYDAEMVILFDTKNIVLSTKNVKLEDEIEIRVTSRATTL